LRIPKPALGKIVRVLSKRSRPVVIILDSYELLALLDGWLRQGFLSRLGKKVRLILVSRFAPAPQWTETSETRGSFRALKLEPLDDGASLRLLASFGADEGRVRAIAANEFFSIPNSPRNNEKYCGRWMAAQAMCAERVGFELSEPFIH
jgi:hypothetical protein